MQAPKEINLSLLGHKDHGKSTLIGRLLLETQSITKDRIEEAKAMSKTLGKDFELAFLLDSFEEEREEGFTLDTTRVQVRYENVIYNLIDVPGHKELVKNMLTGASVAHAAILIISAKPDEGLQNETKLHIYLAHLLGINRLVVAVNKMDAINYSEKRFEEIKNGLSKVLEDFGFNAINLSFIPISAKTGDNITTNSQEALSWYKGKKSIIDYMREFANVNYELEAESLPSRMFIQDVYDVDSDPVIVGRIESGKFKVGQVIKIEPINAIGTIRELHVAGKLQEAAKAGQNVGIKLHCEKQLEIKRGHVCMPNNSKEQVKPVTCITARIFCLPECNFNTSDVLILTSASQEVKAYISKIIHKINPIADKAPRVINGSGEVNSSEAAWTDIKLHSPAVLEPFSKLPYTGRFVISKSGKIVGVGVVN